MFVVMPPQKKKPEVVVKESELHEREPLKPVEDGVPATITA